MTIWLTRPQADSAALAALLHERGIPSIVAPVMRIARRHTPLPAKPEALIMTSRHAAHALPEEWRDLPLYCVGKATAEAARAYGYTHIVTGESDAMELLPQIAQKRLVYFSGADTTVDIVSLLAARGAVVQRIVVYDAIPEKSFSTDLRGLLEARQISGVVFFSTRTATIACSLMKEEEFTESATDIDAYCLSLAVAEAAGVLPWRSLKVSHVPTRNALLAMIAP
jgi:uroporphyrinogen-III synthase